MADDARDSWGGKRINLAAHIRSHWYRCERCGEAFSEHNGHVTERESVCELCVTKEKSRVLR